MPRGRKIKRPAPKIEPNVRVNSTLLAKLRKNNNLSQPVVEKACKIPENVLTAYEHGRIDVPLATARRLAAYFEISLADLLTDESMLALAKAHNKIAEALGIAG